MLKKGFLLFVIPTAGILILPVAGSAVMNNILRGYYREAQRAEYFNNMHSTRAPNPPPLTTCTHSYPFLVRSAADVPFAVWSKAVTGDFRLSILEENKRTVHEWKGRNINEFGEVRLQSGAYTAELILTRYTGAFRFGLNEVIFVNTLPVDRYEQVGAEPVKGFHWDYILYTPENVSAAHLMVIPNNTGYPHNDIRFHLEAAIDLAESMSDLAADLGVPLLVPIFPRPEERGVEFYIHDLDRNVLLMDEEGYRRIDMQLIAMVDDARNRLAEKGISIDGRFVMYGFSASGTFTDRFSVLHPDRLIAVAAGGGSHMLPLAVYNGENLPYPVGVYDYDALTGSRFDAETFASLPRFLFKGDQDRGGTNYKDGTVYPADVYFDLFIRGKLEAAMDESPSPLIGSGEMNEMEETLLKYRIFQRAVFVDEFLAVAEIFAGAGLDASRFKLYPGIGHETTPEMEKDVRDFISKNIRPR
jgi:hypothetical protein